MRLNNKISVIIIWTICLTLTGCGFFPGASLNIDSAKYLNPNVNGNASPVQVIIFQLKDKDNFMNAGYTQLVTTSVEALKDNLIDRQSVDIRPDSSTSVGINLSEDTKYIGVVAAYRDTDQSSWRQIVPIQANKNNDIRVILQSESVHLKVKYAKLWGDSSDS